MIRVNLNGSSNIRDERLIPTNHPSTMIKRIKRSKPAAKRLIQILENGKICFAGRFSFALPSDPAQRQSIEDAINTFIEYLSHRRGLSLGKPIFL